MALTSRLHRGTGLHASEVVHHATGDIASNCIVSRLEQDKCWRDRHAYVCLRYPGTSLPGWAAIMILLNRMSLRLPFYWFPGFFLWNG